MSFALTTEEIGSLVAAGAVAPSGGNLQPWRVTARAASLELRVDPDRSGGMVDVARSASTLALGAFAENVAIESAARGLAHRLEPASTGDDEATVRVVFEGRGAPEAARSPLQRAIAARATNRRAWDGTVIGDGDMGALADAATSVGDGYTLRAVADEAEKRAVARALAEADVVRTFNRELRAEMLSEMRWTDEEARGRADGVDVATLELPEGALTGFKLMRSSLFVSLMVTKRRIRAMTEAALQASSHLCCITMPREPTPAALFDAGRALERVWLTATARGLWMQPWSVAPFFALRAEVARETLAPAEVASIAAITRALDQAWAVGEARRAIFVFRLFRGEPPSKRAVRRPWESFTTIDR